jgi:hypothetical protein
MPHGVLNFHRRVASLQKMIAMPLDHAANPLDLNNVSSNAEYHCSLHNQADRSRAAEQGGAFCFQSQNIAILIR